MDPSERSLRERAKAAMRQRARSLRASVPAVGIAARSEEIAARLEQLPAVRAASRLGVFWPISRNKEVDLRGVLSRWREAGKRLAFPRVIAPAQPLSFAWVDDPSELAERGRGFDEPPPDAPMATGLEVIVVPGLLFDARGHRVGYGAGYYDRTLPALCPPALALGVAFDFQLAAEIPALEEDFPVSLVVTDARVLTVDRTA